MFSRSPTAIVAMKFSSMHRLILLQENFERAWRQDTTVNFYLAKSDSSLNPFKCLVFGHARADALVVEKDSITLTSCPHLCASSLPARDHLAKLYLG